MGGWTERGTTFSLGFEDVCRLSRRSRWRGRLPKCREGMAKWQGAGAGRKEWTGVLEREVRRDQSSHLLSALSPMLCKDLI